MKERRKRAIERRLTAGAMRWVAANCGADREPARV
jgi:hypothetical protein